MLSQRAVLECGPLLETKGKLGCFVQGRGQNSDVQSFSVFLSLLTFSVNFLNCFAVFCRLFFVITFHPESWLHFFAERHDPSLLINEVPLMTVNHFKIWG